jgi:type II secretory pathway pseudopilin PulG
MPSAFRIRVGFTLLEVMIATLILVVGIGAALSTIASSNSFRQSLDEDQMADLILRQMAARLQTTPMTQLGHVYVTPTNQAQGWTLHLRATDAGTIPAATSTASALTQPYSSAPSAYVPPFRPLTQADLVDAAILREPLGLGQCELYVEYYNLSTNIGLQNVGGMLVPQYSGLLTRACTLQDGNPTGSPRLQWYSLVGDPVVSHRTPAAALSPTDAQAANLIMPGTFDLSTVNAAGTTDQIKDALSHGLAIRILVSWIPMIAPSTNAAMRQWRETTIVKRD